MVLHTDEERVNALAALEMNAGNVSKTARETGVPRQTVTLWRDQARDAGQAVAMPAGPTDWKQVREDAAGAFMRIVTKATALLQQQLDRRLADGNGELLTPAGLREIAVIKGIASDKTLDFTLGRKGIEFNIDARRQQANIGPAELPPERLHALLAALDDAVPTGTPQAAGQYGVR